MITYLTRIHQFDLAEQLFGDLADLVQECPAPQGISGEFGAACIALSAFLEQEGLFERAEKIVHRMLRLGKHSAQEALDYYHVSILFNSALHAWCDSPKIKSHQVWAIDRYRFGACLLVNSSRWHRSREA